MCSKSGRWDINQLTSNVVKELLSSGIMFFLFHAPQAYWKKLSPINGHFNRKKKEKATFWVTLDGIELFSFVEGENLHGSTLRFMAESSEDAEIDMEMDEKSIERSTLLMAHQSKSWKLIDYLNAISDNRLLCTKREYSLLNINQMPYESEKLFN